jgi:hypothetical protein
MPGPLHGSPEIVYDAWMLIRYIVLPVALVTACGKSKSKEPAAGSDGKYAKR